MREFVRVWDTSSGDMLELPIDTPRQYSEALDYMWEVAQSKAIVYRNGQAVGAIYTEEHQNDWAGGGAW